MNRCGMFCRGLVPHVALAVLLVGVCQPTQADDLTDAQRSALTAAQTALKNVEANLKLAQSSAGRGEGAIKGSKAKLTQVRLDSAKQYVPQVEAKLTGLPADHAEVKPVAEAFAAAQAGIAALERRLHGGAAPPPDAGGVKLDHIQEKTLKDANYYLNEMEGLAGKLVELAKQTETVEDKKTINHLIINQGVATLAKARDRAGLIHGRLVELPADGRGVAAATQRYNTLAAQTEAAAETLEPLHAMLSDLVNPANYPELDDDVKRLGGLVRLFYDPLTLINQRPAAIEALRQREPAHAEMVRVVQLYYPLIQQQTDQGKRAQGVAEHFLEKYNAFNVAAEAEKAELPRRIRADIDEVTSIADEAVAKQKPLFFTGGIPQVMGFIDEKMALYEALDPEPAAAMAEEIAALKAKVKAQEKSLGELIIQQNPLPPDRYTGADREDVVAVAVDGWKHQQPEFTVLASRIPSEAWERQTKWEYHNGTWYFVDKSRLQVQLLVADENDAALAVIRPVNIIKNHEKGDTLIGVPFYGIDDELQPNAYLLRDKIE